MIRVAVLKKSIDSLILYTYNLGKMVELNDDGDIIMIAGANTLDVEVLRGGAAESQWETISSLSDVHFSSGLQK